MASVVRSRVAAQLSFEDALNVAGVADIDDMYRGVLPPSAERGAAAASAAAVPTTRTARIIATARSSLPVGCGSACVRPT